MSGFAALLDFAVRPDPDREAAMAEAIADRGSHRRAMRSSGPCSMMHAALWTTPEAQHEDQPQRHVTRDIWIVADARIDNREELQSTIGVTRQPLRTDTDLLLAAYERWGVDLVHHVVGDFGFALWDGELDRLLIARDPFGIKPVFIAETPTGVVAASTLRAVLAGIDVTPAVDETFLAGFLHGMPPRERSAWAGVARLTPGHRQLVGRSGSVTERYWSPNLEPLSQSLDATVEQVRTVFDEAVRSRLRTRDGVATDLSGGLDSSTVTATAAGLANIQAVSLAYRTDPEADELDHIRAVANGLGLEPFLVEADQLATLDPVADIHTHREPLYSMDATDTAARHDAATALGCSVALSGVGGDELLYGGNDARLDLVRRSLRAAGMRASADRPDGLVARLARRARMVRARRDRPWLRVPPPPWPAPGPGRGAGATRLAGYQAEWNAPAYELTDRLAAERSVEVRYPFLDRRLVELGLRLPEAQVTVGGLRGLHRRAFGPRLPETVAARTDKAEFSASFLRRMDAALDPDQQVTALAALDDRIDPRGLTSATVWHRWLLLSAGIFLSHEIHPRLTGDSVTLP
jgi:asparagine synthase (glutamine-hydrolysing)